MRGYLRDALLVAAATALSRVFGLVRDAAIADRFGASAAYDAFVVAFFIPHLLRRLLAEGALANAFVPAYAASLTEGEDAQRLANNVLSILLLFFPALLVLGILLAPYYVPFLASGFDADQLQRTVLLTRIVFPFIALVGIAAVYGGVLNAHHRFVLPALSPVLFNLGMIAGALLLWRLFPRQPAIGLALGALLGGAGQLLVHLPSAARLGVRFRFTLRPVHPRLAGILRLMMPALLALAITQINLLVDNKLASHLAAGSISALQFATRLFQLPLGVFAVSVAAALLPRLAVSSSRRQQELFSRQLQHGLLTTLFILLPSALGLLLVATDGVAVLFEHGRFTAGDTLRTARALVAYTLGIAPYGLTYVLGRAYYSLGRGVYPLLAMGLGVATNVGVDLALVGPLGETGLALATSIAGVVNAAVLILGLRPLLRPTPAALRNTLWIAIGCAALVGAVVGVRALGAGLTPVGRLAASIGMGIVVYAAVARVTGSYRLLTRSGEDPPASR
jgi:putative peptidoglycan lipid II flippase